MILLAKNYGGYAAGTVVQFQSVIEQSLVAQGFGTKSTGPVTAGNVATNQVAGRVAVAAGTNQVVITNPSFTTECKFLAYLVGAAPDATATAIVLVNPAAGFVTFTTNANATALVQIDWWQVDVSGESQTP